MKLNRIVLISIALLLFFSNGKAQNKDGSDSSGKKNAKDTDLPESWVNPPPEMDVPLVVHPFSPGYNAPLISMGPDGRLVYKSYSDKGDRLLDWSYCGYERSEVPIPEVPVVETIQPLSGELKSMENMRYPVGTDSRERRQSALDRVNAMATDASGLKGAVLLKRGTYFLSGSLNIGSGVVLRGEGDGENGTILIFSTQDGRDAIELRGEGPEILIENSEKVRIADDYLPSGSISLKLEDASSFEPGDFVSIRKTVNQQWIDDLGMGERLRHIRAGKEGAGKRPWKPESYQFSHLRQITAVNGNTVTLDMVLPQSIEKKHGGGEVSRVNADKLG